MRRRESRGLFVINIFFFFPSVSRCSRERNSALMARQSPCLAELSGQPPEPGGSRPPWREGLTAKARAKPQWPRAITQTNVTAFYVAVDPLSALKCRLRLVN